MHRINKTGHVPLSLPFSILILLVLKRPFTLVLAVVGSRIESNGCPKSPRQDVPTPSIIVLNK